MKIDSIVKIVRPSSGVARQRDGWVGRVQRLANACGGMPCAEVFFAGETGYCFLPIADLEIVEGVGF